MLTLTGPATALFCDRMRRRSFLRIGALAAGGLTLADLLRLEARAGTTATRKSIINIYLPGGPSHMDTFDLKPDAPAEFRGSFRPIDTNVPGMQICEHLPQLAKLGDKLAIIRSVTDMASEHSARQSDSGWSESSLRTMGGRPGLGAVLSKLQGPAEGCPLTAVALSGFTSPGYLGPKYKDYQHEGAAAGNLVRRLDADRLHQRQELLAGLDRFRRIADSSGSMVAGDTFNQQALDVVLSGNLPKALDTNTFSAQERQRYGLKENYDRNRSFLLARRLIETGVRVVSFSFGGWDTHSQNFQTLKQQLPALDMGLSALIQDLEERGRLNDTLILVSGEFGRTPRINPSSGRDHWPAAAFALLAGGGLRTGQVIGSTNRLGERPQDRPVHFQQVFATIYRQLGIDLEASQLFDAAGRPQYVLDHREAISELV